MENRVEALPVYRFVKTVNICNSEGIGTVLYCFEKEKDPSHKTVNAAAVLEGSFLDLSSNEALTVPELP